MRILVGSGGSPHSRLAVDLAAKLARAMPPRDGGVVDVVCVAGGLTDLGQSIDCEEVFTGIAPMLEDVGAHRIVRKGVPARAIVEVAGERGHDLIVVGEKGHHTLARRLVLGETAKRVAERADRPVLLVRGDPEQPARLPRRIMIGLSLHDAVRAERLMRTVVPIARATDADVTLLHVMSQLPGGPESDPRDWQATAEQLVQSDSREGRMLRHDRDLLESHEIYPRLRVRHGLVVDEVVDELRDGSFDLACVGGHERTGWLDHVLLEDIAARIVHAAPCSVIVVHGHVDQTAALPGGDG